MIRLNEALVIPFRHWIGIRPRPHVEFANIGEGIRPTGMRTYKADAGITGQLRFLLVKQGSDADHVTLNSAAADKILGVAYDEPAAVDDELTVALLGAQPSTVKMVCGGAVTIGDILSCDGAGKVVTGVATRYAVGMALMGGVLNDVIEVDPIRGDRVL